jgi:fucokinase
VRLTDELITNAHRMRDAILNSDLAMFGTCLSTYWQQKKRMAGGAEPLHVTEMIDRLNRAGLIHGCALGGAGGGGFLMVVMKEKDEVLERCRGCLEGMKDSHVLTYHAVEIDEVGLVSRIEQ